MKQRKFSMVFGGLMALALSPLLWSVGVQAADTAYESLTAASADAPEGFLRVTTAGWSLTGDPPRLRFCLSSRETKGVLSNDFKCTRWGNAQDYLNARYPGKRVALTRWDFNCAARGNSASAWCDQEIVLYYRIAPR